MKRRLLCAILALVLLVGLVPFTAVQASAASALKTSDLAIEVIKGFEGFRAKAYLDNGGYTIGYGTRCEKDAYPNGITENQAEELMRQSLGTMETFVNKMIDKYSLKLTQNQFDALMVFTYNFGPAWTQADSDFRNAIIKGMTGNDFLFYITRWSNVNETLSVGLINRRLAEADMYLNGYYSTKAPENYTYVIYDVNGGNSVDVKVQGYDACTPVAVRAVPAYTGYRFLGWYTEKEGGQLVTDLDATTKGITLYAHWQKNEDDTAEDALITGTPASYERIASGELKIYDAPQTDAASEKTVAKDASVSIVADYVDANGVKWGKLKDGGWIDLSGTTVKTTAAEKPVRQEQSASSPETGITVTITGNFVNFRKGAGTDQTVIGSYPRGYKIVVTEVKEVEGVKWGKFKDGWMCLTYTNYDLVVPKDDKDDTTTETVIATGTVKDCGSLRFRSGAGLKASILGTIPGGTKVEILEMNADKSWGRISLGWISMSYVILDTSSTDTEKPDAGETKPDEGETKPEEGETKPDQGETKPDEGETKPETPKTVTGIVTATIINVREGAGLDCKAISLLPKGRQITITEQMTFGNMTWGKCEYGWVCMEYIRVNEDASSDADNSGSATTEGVKGTVTAGVLCVRSGAGTNYEVLTSIAKGTTVTVTEQKTVGGAKWGKIDKGWICLVYVKLEQTTTGNTGNSGNTENTGNTGSTVTGSVKGTVNANVLCVRTGAGTNYAMSSTLTKGTVVTVTEQKLVGGLVWGKTSTGWICMNYVSIDSSTGSVAFQATVTASNLCIRSAAGTNNSVVGGYIKGEVIKIYETKYVNGQDWGRTDRGWISMKYVK